MKLRIEVKVDADELLLWDAYAAQQDRTRSQMVRAAVRGALRRHAHAPLMERVTGFEESRIRELLTTKRRKRRSVRDGNDQCDEQPTG